MGYISTVKMYPTVGCGQAQAKLDPDFLYAYPFDGSVCGFL